MMPQSRRQFALYTHSAGNYYFCEIRDLLIAGLMELGFEATARTELDGFTASADWHLVIAPHEFFYLGVGRELEQQPLPRNLILLNSEQPLTRWFVFAYRYFSNACAIWDLHDQTSQLIRDKGFPCRHLPLGYVPEFAPFREVEQLCHNTETCHLEPEITHRSYLHKPLMQRPLDILFVGALTPRREAFFAQAAPVLSRYRCTLRLLEPTAPLIPGVNTELDTTTMVGIEQRSKVVLNLHRDRGKYFEWHRMVPHGIWQRALVISETCNPAAPFQPGIDFVQTPLADMPAAIEHYLSTSDGRAAAHQISTHGFDTLTQQCRLADVLTPLIGELEGSP